MQKAVFYVKKNKCLCVFLFQLSMSNMFHFLKTLTDLIKGKGNMKAVFACQLLSSFVFMFALEAPDSETLKYLDFRGVKVIWHKLK